MCIRDCPQRQAVGGLGHREQVVLATFPLSVLQDVRYCLRLQRQPLASGHSAQFQTFDDIIEALCAVNAFISATADASEEQEAQRIHDPVPTPSYKAHQLTTCMLRPAQRGWSAQSATETINILPTAFRCWTRENEYTRREVMRGKHACVCLSVALGG